MPSALLMKSVRDLTARPVRTALATLTIALAVVGLSVFGASNMVDEAVAEEMEENQVFHLFLQIHPHEMNASVRAEILALDDVAVVDTHVVHRTQIWVENGDDPIRYPVLLIGVRDFDDQRIDRVLLDGDAAPGDGEVLAAAANNRLGLAGLPTLDEGDSIWIADGAKGSERVISGTGRSLLFYPDNWDNSLFFMDAEDAWALGAPAGWNTIDIRLHDSTPESRERVIEQVRVILENTSADTAFANLPFERDSGVPVAKDGFDDVMSLFVIVSLLALISSAVLILNTFNTMVVEQTREIGALRAIGARKSHILRIYVTTALLLGSLGSLVGVLLAIPVDNMLIRVIGEFPGYTTAFIIHWPTLFWSFVAGVALSIIATIPALVRATLVPVRAALQETGVSADFGQGAVDQALMAVGGGPAVRIGVRNLARRKSRTLATTLQVALSVGAMLGFMAIGASLVDGLEQEYDLFGWQIAVNSGSNGVALDPALEEDLLNRTGVSAVESYIVVQGELNEARVLIWGLEAEGTMYRYETHFVDGRWFTPVEQATNASVVVISESLSDRLEKGVGDRIELTTPAGTIELDIVGIDWGHQQNGNQVFMPISTLRHDLGRPDLITGMRLDVSETWDDDDAADRKEIQRLAQTIEDEFTAAGHTVEVDVMWLAKEDNQQGNMQLLSVIMTMGLIIVAISLLGLVNALTMGVLERTREIGVLRSIGAHGRQIRRMFRVEGVALATLGWAAGAALGVGITWTLNQVILNTFNIEFPMLYPLLNVAIALVATVALTLFVTALPLRRASSMRPGDALRYL